MILAFQLAMRHHRQQKKRRIVPWPPSAPLPAALAAQVKYVGSHEHKTYPSSAGAPMLRHADATPCDPKYKSLTAPDQALKAAVQARTTSDFVGSFPKYVWGFLDGELYEARLVNHEQGTYKGYRLEHSEWPDDPFGLLDGPRDG